MNDREFWDRVNEIQPASKYGRAAEAKFWTAILVLAVGILFALIAGIEQGRSDVDHLMRMDIGERYQLPQHTGLWARKIGTCNAILPPAECGVFQILMLDRTQGQTVQPFPWQRDPKENVIP